LDIKHAVTFVNAIDRALLDTRFIFDINTRLSDYIGHESSSRKSPQRPADQSLR